MQPLRQVCKLGCLGATKHILGATLIHDVRLTQSVVKPGMDHNGDMKDATSWIEGFVRQPVTSPCSCGWRQCA
eukprot:3218077-Amphidinium_carterae.2